MPEAYDDEVLLSALEHARGFDRELIIGALGKSEGSGGPDALRRYVRVESGETGTARAAALGALGRRVGSDGTELYSSALRDRSIYVQLAAMHVLALVGDVSATQDVFEWFERKLRRKGRTRSWDPSEIPEVLRYADRNGLLPEFAVLLRKHMSMLEDAERTWLSLVWPFVAAEDSPLDGEVPAPDRERLSQPLFEEHRSDPNPEVEKMWDGFVREALANAQRRGARRH